VVGSLIQLFLPGDSKYSIKRGPHHLVDEQPSEEEEVGEGVDPLEEEAEDEEEEADDELDDDASESEEE
jgi:hypothetical protein